MKKLLAAALTLAIAIIPSLPALAAAVNGGDDHGIGITGSYTPTSTGDAISFDLEWDAMDFTYNGGTLSDWDENSHTYGDGYVPAGWIEEQKQIKITNHSHIALYASLTFVSAATGVKGVFDASSLSIESADADAYRTQGADGKYPAPSAVSKFSIDPTSDPIDANKSLGKITVSVSVTAHSTVIGNPVTAGSGTSASGNAEGYHDIDVNGTHVAPTGGADKICIDITWTGMSFEYNGGKPVWDDTTHTYTGTVAGWSDHKGSIEVVNHSNVAVTASFTFTKDAALAENVVGTFYSNSGGTYSALASSEQNISLVSAVGTTRNDTDPTLDTSPRGSIYFGISGDAITDNTTLGNITVQITKN